MRSSRNGVRQRVRMCKRASRLRKLVCDLLSLCPEFPLMNREINAKKKEKQELCMCWHGLISLTDSASRVTRHIPAACTGFLQQVPTPTSTRYVPLPAALLSVDLASSDHRLGHNLHSDYLFLCCILIFSGSRARSSLPFYSNSGCRGPDRQEGPAHQTTCPFCWCVYQGEVVGVDSVLLDEHTNVRLDRRHHSKLP